VLSKGHAALALYAVLGLKGLISPDQTSTYCIGQTMLGVHPEHKLTGVDFCTGSLGMGLSMATGAALAARLQKSPRRVWALLSDAECDEGSTWEAVMFAVHHRLSHLTAIIDFNGQQAFGHTRDVLDQSTMAERWRAFGWAVEEVDGHDVAALTAALERPCDAAPRVLIAHTVFGKGVSFMERQVKWHYQPMSAEQFAQAMKEIETTP
jgi:transketolase